jgi:hypothetical protein
LGTADNSHIEHFPADRYSIGHSIFIICHKIADSCRLYLESSLRDMYRYW